MSSADSTLESLKDALGDAAGEAVTTWAAINTKHVEMGHGLYGHSTAKVAAVHLQDEDGAPEHKIIVKAFGSESARDNEATRHRAARRDAPEFAARHLVDLAFDSIACGDGGVVMFQELAKGGLQEHAPMQALVGKASAGVAAGKICDSLLTEWNATGTRPESLSLAEMMNLHLGVRIEPGGKLWVWADTVPQLLREPVAWLRIAGEMLPNPLAFALSPRLSGSVGLRVQRGRIHGDLHVNNIMCATPSDEPFEFRLVDLASYSSNLPLAWDQASLLVSVVRHWLDDVTDPALTSRLLRFLSGGGGPEGLPPALCQAVATIRTTSEQWAEAHGWLDGWRTQFQAAEVSSALILAGRSSLAPSQRWWFFHLAARQLDALLARLGVREPATPFEIDEAALVQRSPAPRESRHRDVRTGVTPTGYTKPRVAWSQRQQFANTVNELRFAASEEEFARVARANLAVAFGGLVRHVVTRPSDVVPGLVLVEAANSHDTPLRIAVQFADLGRGDDWFTDHAAESVRSVRRFQRSGLAADHYLFVHNRDHRDDRYNAAVLEALDSLTALGDVGWSGLWDYRDLVKHVWQAVYERCHVVIADYSDEAATVLSGLVHHDPLTEVPFRRHRATFSNRGFEMVSDESDELGDPVPGLVAQANGVHLVLGEFGFGKTTAVVRASRSSNRRVLLVPASRLTSDKAYLLDIMSTVLQHGDGGDHEDLVDRLWREISPRCLDVMLRSPQDDLLLIFDGLDEAPMAQRRSGLLDFLQALRKINVPVLVSARTEFWHSRRDEVRASMPEQARESPLQHITTTELRPWTRECMVALVDRSLELDGPSTFLDEFRLLIEDGRYDALYGDIPCRPLFLDMLIDDVRQAGVRARSRLEVTTDWIYRKIERDWHNPKATGGATRPPIRGDRTETLDRTGDRAFQLMAAASRRMISWEDPGQFALLPTVRIDELLDDGPVWFADVDPEALAVQSVLLPAVRGGRGSARLFRFAHHAFQEYFLAHSLHHEPDPIVEAAAPEQVQAWLHAMRSALLD